MNLGARYKINGLASVIPDTRLGLSYPIRHMAVTEKGTIESVYLRCRFTPLI